MLKLDMREGSEGNGLIIGGIVLGLAGLLFFAGLVVVGFIAFGTSSRPPVIKPALPQRNSPAPPVPASDLTDPNQAKIEKVIREKLKKPTGELTKSDLEKVTKLHLSGMQLTEVKGLDKLTQLTYLDLSDNKLTSVKGLEKLTQLKYLGLDRNQLTDVKGLEKLTHLDKK